MADKIIKKKIEFDLRPAYYDDFHCLAQDCQISCCKGWRISFDRKDYLALRRLHGSEELNRRMSKSLSRIKDGKINYYAEFALDGDACPLLAEDGLCILQKECGHDALPYVCRIYPRREGAWLSGYFERSLSPSCEAVLELLWNLPQGIDFASDPLPKNEQTTEMLPNPENSLTHLTAHFQEIRSLCIDILQDRRFSMAQRILLMGIYLQKLTAEGEIDIPQWLEETAAVLSHPQAVEIAAQLTPESPKNIRLALFNHVKTLVLLNDVKKDSFSAEMIARTKALLVRNQVSEREEMKLRVDTNLDGFLAAREKFLADFGADEYFMENFAVTVFFYMDFPMTLSKEALWQSYISFCNIYSFARMMAICSYMEAAEGEEAQKAALFRALLFTGRTLLHNAAGEKYLQEEFFLHENSSLAHMQILLSL